MGPGGCNDCLAPAYGYVAVRRAASEVIGFLAVNDSTGLEPDIHRNREKPNEEWEAALRFRRNLPFVVQARNAEAVTQGR